MQASTAAEEVVARVWRILYSIRPSGLSGVLLPLQPAGEQQAQAAASPARRRMEMRKKETPSIDNCNSVAANGFLEPTERKRVTNFLVSVWCRSSCHEAAKIRHTRENGRLRKQLTRKMLSYNLHIYSNLSKQRHRIPPSPPRPWSLESCANFAWRWGVGRSLFSGTWRWP